MNVVMVGAGAVGGYIGGRFEEAGLPVSFLVRQRRAAQLRQNGISIKSTHGDYTSKSINIYTDPEDIPACDVAIVSVKGYHLPGVLPQLKQLVQKGAKVLPFLNGIEHIQILKRELGSENVLGGLVYIFSTLDENGAVIQTGQLHDFAVGALDPSQEELCAELERVAQPAKINVTNHQDISYALWKKYMFITALSGITTASRLPIGKVREVPATVHLSKEILLEIQRLARAYNVHLQDDEIDGAMQQIHDLPAENTSSMHKDLQKGKPIEVENLHGGALNLAKEKSLTLPFTRSIYALLKPYENGSSSESTV